MSQLEYLLPLVSIIIGLGLADLAQSVRELIRPERAVRWHWLPVLWVIIALLLVLQIWWTASDILRAEAFGEVLVFLPYLLNILGLYLLCAFALPDPDWTAGTWEEDSQSHDAPRSSSTVLDLKAFYFSSSHRRWFFGTLVAITVLFEIISFSFLLVEADQVLFEVARRRWPVLGLVAGLAALIATDRWWVHTILSVVSFGGVVFSLFSTSPLTV
jgi:hypothetical protein